MKTIQDKVRFTKALSDIISTTGGSTVCITTAEGKSYTFSADTLTYFYTDKLLCLGDLSEHATVTYNIEG